MRYLLIIPALCALAGTMSTLTAQTRSELPAISADRPGQSIAPSVQIPGTLQIEAGVQLTGDATSADQAETTVQTLSAPTALLRIGLLPTMELRLSTELRSVRTRTTPGASDTTVSGLSGIGIGTKIGVTTETGMIPETSFLLALALPVGAESFRVAAVAPGFLFAMRNSLSGTTSLYYNVGAAWDGTHGAGSGQYSLLVSNAPTPSLGLFAEIYGTLSTGLAPLHAADLGVTYLTGSALQLDISAGAAITDNAPDYFIAGGVSLRLPR